MRIDLIKYQALGNDYFVLDLPAPLDAAVEALPALCDRHLGLGSDGLLAFDPKAMSLRIFNPDRSEAQKSGNGLRIAAPPAGPQHGAGDRAELPSAPPSSCSRWWPAAAAAWRSGSAEPVTRSPPAPAPALWPPRACARVW